MSRLLEVPEFFQPDRVGELWRVPYAERANDARQWAAEHDLPPAADDRVRVGLLAIDVQNTFCLPDFELFVAGRSGTGAIDDTVRFCRFLYQNLDRKSTRLNSSHQIISYAVFCLKKKNNKIKL